MPYYEAVMADSPSIYYRLDETGAGPFVDEIAARNADTSGAIVTAASLLNTDLNAAARFDPATTLNKATTNPVYTIAQQPMTIEFWIIPFSLTGSSGGASSVTSCLNAGTTQGWEVAYEQTTGIWRLLLCNVAFYSFTAAHKAVVGTKQHVVYKLTTGPTACELFINGVSQGSLAVGTMVATTSAFVVSGSNATGNGGRPNCTLDEVAIYPTALSATRILDHFQEGAGPGPQRVAGWSSRSRR